jgi:acetyl-CoA/propionyl-CoA carboxylase biotin carboxyl carrier protein
MIRTVLIANRGEIAVRVIRGCRSLGLQAAVVHSSPDAGALHTRLADSAIALDGTTAAETYLNVDKVIAAAQAAGADAVHPGYGFLAENAAFAEAVAAAGLTWIGPPAAAIRAMGDKVTARATAARAGIAGVPGTEGPVASADEVLSFADEHGYPLVIKAAAGGGGRGMRVVRTSEDVGPAIEAARREAGASFGDDHVYVEKYLEWPRHVEVQILCDGHGRSLAIGERDCSVQRRHQKLIEEAPAPNLSGAVRRGLADAAVAVARAVGYVGAGTVEFLVEGDRFYFLEMNTRLQVEHPVTEMVFGVDLVAEQLRIAAGQPLSIADIEPRGHAIECRINAEDPAGGRFLPHPGAVARLDVPQGPGLRFDAGYAAGDVVSPFYDNLVGKLIAWGRDREAARRVMIDALRELRVEGIPTTAPAQIAILEHPDFIGVDHATPWLESGAVALPAGQSAGGNGEDLVAAPVEAGSAVGGAEDEREVIVVGRRYWLGPPVGAEPSDRRPASARPRSEPPLRDSARRADGGGRAAAGDEQRAAARVALEGAITSPMQGTVISVGVEPGAKVERGRTLLVLEAMKMESEIVADRDGTVTELRVTVGDSVASGDVLAVIE